MNNQQPQNESLLNFDDAKAAIEKGFASMIGTLSLNNAILEKRLASSQQTVSQLTESEIGLVGRIADLEAETAQLRHQLLKHQLSSLPQPLSPEAAALAAEGSSLLEEKEDKGYRRKEKAAPVEAAYMDYGLSKLSGQS